MKDFKQNQKMHAQGKHYCSGKSVRKYAEGGSIDDDVRARAMKWIESGSPEKAEAPAENAAPESPAPETPAPETPAEEKPAEETPSV